MCSSQPLCFYATQCLRVALIAVSMSLLGCGEAGPEGPPIHPVAGKITFEGKPVTSANVSFYMQKEQILYGADGGSDGTYRIKSQFGDGLPAGTYQVRIMPAIPPAKESTAPDPASLVDAEPVEPLDVPDIPKKYHDFASSGLTAEVKEGSGPFDFNMKP